jgi:hypothetical protein
VRAVRRDQSGDPERLDENYNRASDFAADLLQEEQTDSLWFNEWL